jgi:hypothetical protein
VANVLSDNEKQRAIDTVNIEVEWIQSNLIFSKIFKAGSYINNLKTPEGQLDYSIALDISLKIIESRCLSLEELYKTLAHGINETFQIQIKSNYTDTKLDRSYIELLYNMIYDKNDYFELDVSKIIAEIIKATLIVCKNVERIIGE